MEEFFPKITEEDKHPFIMLMLEECKEVIDKYGKNDDGFAGTYEYMDFRTEMIGSIQLYMESHDL